MLHNIFGEKSRPARTLFLFLSLIIALSLQLFMCDDPASKDKDTLIRTRWDGPIQAGTYSLFWDGTDDNGEYVSPGIYICRLYTRDYSQDIEMTAQEGSSGKSNADPYHWSPTTATYFLHENNPNPFFIEDGTNIIFDIPKSTSIRLTIHTTDENE